jgi:hypothetical protein
LFIFQGKSVVLLVIGVGVFVALFRILASLDVDWWINLVISLLPLAAMTGYVHWLVNGKAPSYAADLLQWHVFRFRCWLYMAGALNRPPELWFTDRKLSHPKEY